MEVGGKFLAIVSNSFKNDKGEEIVYHRLHVWAGSETVVFPISQTATDSALAEGVKFGDDVHVKLTSGKNADGATIWKVINW
jgi:hypothetical protein